MQMKLQLVFAVLAFVHPSAARGLKTPKVSATKQLEAENAALRARNKHLEAMMQVARSEVHRMDQAAHSRNHPYGTDDLLKKLRAVEADKKSLVQTLRQMLAKNATKIFQTQANNALAAKKALEMKCGKERATFEAQVKEATSRCDDTKEMAQTLQEQNMDLQRTVHDLQERFSASEQNQKELTADKANLVATMHNLMRESNGMKKALHTERQEKKIVSQELATDEAFIANLTKKKTQPPADMERKTSSPKRARLHMNTEESDAVKFAKLNAKMNHINTYIDRAQMPSDDGSDDAPGDDTPQQAAAAPATPSKDNDAWSSVTKQVDDLQKQEDVAAKKHAVSHVSDSPKAMAEAAAVVDHNEGLGDWLGLPKPKKAAGVPRDANGLSPIDALDPDAVKQEKAAEAKKAKDDEDDGGDGIQGLLDQAKGQLAAMDSAEAQTSF